MIRNNKLYYSSIEAPWQSFEISQPSLSSFVTSVLTTLISYQMAAILFDVVLGLKKRHEAKLKHLAIVVLTRYLSSPLAILNSLIRKDWITRLYYGRDIPQETTISRNPERVKTRTAFVVLLLLIATPLIDIVLLALALSRTNALDFDKAGFGAVGFGVSDTANALETTPYLSFCDTVSFEERSSDVLESSFRLCESPGLPEDEEQNVTGIEITMDDGYSVATRVIFQGFVILGLNWARLQTEEGDFFVKAEMTEESAALLVQTALEGFSEFCGETNVIGAVPAKRNDQFSSRKVLIASVGISCDNASTTTPAEKNQITSSITSALRKRLTLVSTDQLLVRKESDLNSDFTEQRNITFLRRTEKNASLFSLIVASVLLLLSRVIVRTVFASDVEEGLLHFIRDQLPVPRYKSLLRASEERIFFRMKYQVGEHGYYGMVQPDLPETERFEGGVVGGDEIRSWRECAPQAYL